jgi:hypothetical protein
MKKLFAAMIMGVFILFAGASAVAGVTVTDAVLSKEKQESGQAQQKGAKKSGEKAGNAATTSTAGSKTKK